MTALLQLLYAAAACQLLSYCHNIYQVRSTCHRPDCGERAAPCYRIHPRPLPPLSSQNQCTVQRSVTGTRVQSNPSARFAICSVCFSSGKLLRNWPGLSSPFQVLETPSIGTTPRQPVRSLQATTRVFIALAELCCTSRHHATLAGRKGPTLLDWKGGVIIDEIPRCQRFRQQMPAVLSIQPEFQFWASWRGRLAGGRWQFEGIIYRRTRHD